MGSVVVSEVNSSRDLSEFLEFVYDVQGGLPSFVPPLKVAVKDTLDVQKNPFFRHAYRALFLARKDGRVVGRIAAIIDDEHNRYHNERSAFFGFFECIDDTEVSRLLFDRVKLFALERGMIKILGPMNPSTNHECGLLVEGFLDPPTVMNTYNPEYYGALVESQGYTKAKDLLAYNLDSRKDQPSDRLMAHVEKLRQNGSVTFRPINVRRFDQEVATILEIYNDAWEKNWGFVPMNPSEFAHMAKDLKMILDPELLLIAEVKGEPVGFGLALPDVNQVLKKIKRGKLTLFSIGMLWIRLKVLPKRYSMNRCRILTLGVKRRFQQLGIGPLLYAEYFRRGPGNGYFSGEASWVLEDNVPMNRALTQMSRGPCKRYRIYSLDLQPSDSV